jgi:CubicO group peptidase (beta-lactamase class C family)
MRHRRTKSFLVVILALLAATSASPRFQSNTFPADTASHVDHIVANFLSHSHAPGVAVSIVLDGKPAFARGYGEADTAHHRPVTPDTLFRLASVSKPITATGAMQLWQAGKLDLDAPIQKYCPQFPVKPYPITTRELLGHLGGIRHYGDLPHDPEEHNTKHFDDPIAGGFSFFANDALVAVPGQTFHYSTHGYTLVGCAIQGASGESYVSYITKNVLAPARMSHTVVDDATKTIAERASFYTVKDGKVVTANEMDSSYKIPGGGWLSSANDMAAFAIAMLDDKLVTRATRDLMWTPQKTTTGSPDHYGYGFGIAELEGVKTVAHTGGQEGTATNLTIAPEKNAAVIVLINADGVDATALSKEILRAVLATDAKAAAAR